MQKPINNRLYFLRTVLIYFYAAGILCWAAISIFFGDQWWWLFIINSFSIYLFLPLPLLIFDLFFFRNKPLWIPKFISLIIFLFFFGNLFLPKNFALIKPTQETITIMTFNSLGANQSWKKTINALSESNADVVAIQELNGEIAKAIKNNLSEIYPYQALYPEEGTCGTGIISRYPIEELDGQFPNRFWCPKPQINRINFNGNKFLLINIHAKASSPGGLFKINNESRIRSQQAKDLITFYEKAKIPVIIAGDLNATIHSTAYKTITQHLKDAWVHGGWGLGHTFPGGNMPGGSRPKIAGYFVPQWLVRIDYIFLSNNWQTVQTKIGPWDRGSDHRPVITQIYLK